MSSRERVGSNLRRFRWRLGKVLRWLRVSGGSNALAGLGRDCGQSHTALRLGGAHWRSLASQCRPVGGSAGPISELLFNRAGLESGHSVLDVGCGRGSTTRAAAAMIGRGKAVGLDLSEEMISGARDLDPMDRCAWITADATDVDLSHLASDILISRFGLMFFPEPVRAILNVRRALRPNGRLVAVVWQQRHESPFQHLPFTAAGDAAARHGLSLPLGAPDGGAFSFGRPEIVEQVMQAAGWVNVSFERHQVPVHVAGPGATAAKAAELFLGTGPIATWLASLESSCRSDITGAMERELASHFDGTGIRQDAGIAVVTAKSPGE